MRAALFGIVIFAQAVPSIGNAAPLSVASAEIALAERIKNRVTMQCDGNLFVFKMMGTEEVKNASPIMRAVAVRNPTELEKLNSPELGMKTVVYYYYDADFTREYKIERKSFQTVEETILKFTSLAPPNISPWSHFYIRKGATPQQRMAIQSGIAIEFVRINGKPKLTKISFDTATSENTGFLLGLGEMKHYHKITELFQDYAENASKAWVDLNCNDYKNPAIYVGKIFSYAGSDNYINFVDDAIGANGDYKSAMSTYFPSKHISQGIKFGASFVDVVLEGEDGQSASAISIASVVPKSIAFDNGFMVDDIILRVNGVNIASKADLIAVLSAISPGQMFDVVYFRDGSVGSISVKAK